MDHGSFECKGETERRLIPDHFSLILFTGKMACCLLQPVLASLNPIIKAARVHFNNTLRRLGLIKSVLSRTHVIYWSDLHEKKNTLGKSQRARLRSSAIELSAFTFNHFTSRP